MISLKDHLSALGRPLRVVVTGGRYYRDMAVVEWALDGIHKRYTIESIAHGGARGADALAGAWAKQNGVLVTVYEADWSVGRRGGPQRNRRMLDAESPDIVVSFKGNDGTLDCCLAADERGIPVWCVGWSRGDK